MKRIIACVLLIVLCASSFIACSKKGDDAKGATTVNPDSTTAPTDDPLEAAKAFIFNMYKDKGEMTPSDYDVVGATQVSGVTYSIEWTVEITSGATDSVKVVVGENNKVTIDVNEKTDTEVVYKLTATIKGADGKTISVSFDHKVPAYKELSWAEYIAAKAEESVVVKGVVTGIMAKSRGNSYNCLYLQDKDGGYYAYALAKDPVTEDNVEIGMTVKITGTKDIYSGTHEIKSGTVEIIDSNKTAVTALDYTEKFKSAADLKDASIVSQQAMLVTLKGVEITGQDEKNGYLKFKLGTLESYIRISSSVCPLTKDEQTAFMKAHSEKLGWLANATGVICVYDGAFYLTPVSADAYEYTSLPTKTDVEMVAFEKENLTIAETIEKDTVLNLIATGKSYTQVAVTWVSDNACAVVADGKLTVTLQETAQTVKLTATFKCGEATDTKEFTIAVDAVSADLYVAKAVESPVKDTAYTLALHQASLGKDLYFTGAMSGNYLATTDKADKAVDVYLEEATGGFLFYFKNGETKTYIEIYEYQANKGGVKLVTEKPATAFVYNADAKTFTVTIGTNTYYLGTYKTYNTVSVSNISYISGDNASAIGVSQFPTFIGKPVPAAYRAVDQTTPVKDTPYTLALHQANLGKDIYFTGAMSGNYLATTDKAEKAVPVYLEEATGGFLFYFMNGETKTYIEIYEYQANKGGVKLVTEKPATVFVYNKDAETYTVTIGTNTYYLGTYKTYNTVSVSNITYISGDNASAIGVSQFPTFIAKPVLEEVFATAVEAPVKDTAYKLALHQANLDADLYFSGAMSGNYLATTDRPSKATDVYLEETTGGFCIYFKNGETKTYIEIYEYQANKGGVKLVTEKPATAFVYNADAKTFTVTIGTNTYYFGTYKTYNTVSVSNISYISGDNASAIGVSQFPTFIATIEFAK